jgi:hypothetical protein
LRRREDSIEKERAEEIKKRQEDEKISDNKSL